ncbi:glycosyltransferase family 4 protein [Noviherbaspirillum massiliense]|uniref:glycosyltransferase family 4 protein n=1 Tax=Noviherbaspirillum massiliense TaxID=1465823 RepID=UPI0003804419|nr:glycosyltransferase family 1 protein [Noviherbaspirillum massiliense]
MRLVDLTLFYTVESGGIRTYLTSKARWLARHTRVEHIIVGPSLIDAQAEPAFVSVPSVPVPYAPGYRMPLSTRLAAQKVARLKPDLIEVGDPYQFAWTALRVKRKLDIPVLAFCHSDLPRLIAHRFGTVAQPIAADYLARLYRRFDLVLAPSKAMMQRLQELGIENVEYQPLGVDTETFSPRQRDPQLRDRLGIPEGARLLVFAGRFTREKNLPLLLEAVRRLGPPYHLLMVGCGADFPPQERVSYLPFQSDQAALASVLASCDLLVHPGDRETFGLIVLEAMASGIPVVGTAAGGVRELVDPDTGVLVEPGSADKLAEGIIHAFEMDCAALGAAARRRAVEKFSWESIFPQLLGHYNSLLAAYQQVQPDLGTSYVPD